MLKFLQKEGPVKKIVLGAILVVICVMMVITLVPGGKCLGDFLGGGVTQEGVLAVVGNQSVGLQEVRAASPYDRPPAVPRQRARAGLMPFLMQRAAGQQITQGAMVYEADRMGLGVSNDEVPRLSAPGAVRRNLLSRRQLHRRPGGCTNGREPVRAERGGSSRRSSRRRSRRRKLLAAVGAPAVTVSEKQKSRNKSIKTRSPRSSSTTPSSTLDDLKKQFQPTDAELKAYYDQNKQEYVNAIPGEAQGALHRDRHREARGHDSVQRRRPAAVLQPAPRRVPRARAGDRPPHPDQDAGARMPTARWTRRPLRLRQEPRPRPSRSRCRTGGNFAELAKQFSDDPGSRTHGGLLLTLSMAARCPSSSRRRSLRWKARPAAWCAPPSVSTSSTWTASRLRT